MSSTRLQLNQGLDNLSTTTAILNVYGLVHGPIASLGSVTGTKGTNVSIPIKFTKGSGLVASLQFDILFAGLTFQGASIGPAGTAAGKSIVTNPITGGIRLLIFGLNQTIIESGLLATFSWGIPSTSSSGIISLGVSGPVASNAAGIAVPLIVSTGMVIV